MRKREIQASVGQRLLWLKHEYEGESGALNCPVLCGVEGRLDRSVLHAALGCLVVQHESLRTTFVRRGRDLRQVIHEPKDVQAQFQDLSGTDDRRGVVEALVKKELRTSIDPAAWPMRVTLWRLGKESHLLCINLHHLVTDTWSCMVLQRQLCIAYEQCQSGVIGFLPAGWQFSQFMAWQQRQIEGNGFCRHREYWRRHLAGASAPRLPLRPIKSRAERRSASIRATIDAVTTQRLRDLATKYRTTLFTVALSAYHVLLNRLTGQSDLAVATLFANRTRREVENTVGFLANLAVLRTRLDSVLTFLDVIERVRITVLDGLSHQALPFHLVSQGAFSSNSPRPDDIVFQMLSEGIDDICRTGQVEFQALVPDVGGRFDLELALMPLGDCLAVKLYYAENRLSSAWARDFLSGFVAVTAAVASNPNEPLTKLPADLPMSGDYSDG